MVLQYATNYNTNNKLLQKPCTVCVKPKPPPLQMHQHVSGDGGEALQLEDGVHNLVLYLHDGTHSILLWDAALCQKIHLCLKTGNLLPDFQIAHTILKLKSIVIPPDRPS